MLENLHVKNLALIEEAEISFKEGFNVLTGETGAGKSIVLGSVNLALGAKANTDVIRTGKDSALVELSFSLNDEQIKALKNMDIDVDADEGLLLQRKIMPGKSICRVNGETVSVSQLKELSGILINMYGQHEHQTLLKASTYAKMLDEYAGDGMKEYLAELGVLWDKYKSLTAQKESEDTDTSVRNRELELLQFEVAEIDAANLSEGEDEELEKRYRFLTNARKIMEGVQKCAAATGGESDEGASAAISYAVGSLKTIASYDEEAQELLGQLSEIENLLNDFNRALGNYESKLNFDEEEYVNVENRLNEINRLKGKYGDSISKILSSREQKQQQIDKYINFEEYLCKLNADLDAAHKELLAKCAAISSLRRSAAKPLEKSLIEALRALNFLDVRLSINIVCNEDNISSTGYDEIEFLISLNPGEDLKPMQNIASGGELSRIMLAFKSVFADAKDVSTLIFDEIDAGISGVTAYKVAEKIGELSQKHQILCVTHLPQIAAMADAHYKIEKSIEDGRTVTRIYPLNEEGAVGELARMLGTDEISDSALANARELRKKAKG